jgi:DNA/RNA-binding domain of Phe-tRNA-synthetase-like protein
MSDPVELRPAEGFVEPTIRDEFPGLRLHWITVRARRARSPDSLVQQLHQLSSRVRGASVVAMRTKPIPHAYRAFFRQIGLDPDVNRIPSEDVAVTRLMRGGFRSAGLIPDARLVSLLETGVPVWALDGDLVDAGGPGIRTATSSDFDATSAAGVMIEPGSLVVADQSAVHAVLFGEPLSGREPGSRTERVTLFAVGVDGVPDIHIDEALWICAELLG